ncbi:MAG: TIGR04282 family arsenosugar biosynthesis glycosyltransferase [Oligoflexus sp.]
MSPGAAAIFVKTIGYSPLKTRLASGIGESRAYEFYRLACDCIVEQLQACETEIQGVWAIAETQLEAQARWQHLPVVMQGEGDLADRLAAVYSQLIARYPFAALLGADAPQVSQHLFSSLGKLLEHFDFVVGPARDGGFYVFAGRLPLSQEFWQNIPYSDAKTCEILLQELQAHGTVHILKTLTDVDILEDLPFLQEELKSQIILSERQKALLEWIDATLESIANAPSAMRRP